MIPPPPPRFLSPLPPPLPPPLPLPRVLTVHRGKTLGWLVFDSVTCYSCISAREWIWWVAAFILGIGAVRRLLHLLPGSSHLKLTSEGLIVRTTWRDRLLPWEFLEEFSAPKSWGNALEESIEVRFTPSAPTDLPYLTLKGSGASTGLIPGFGNGAASMAELLNRYLRQAKAERRLTEVVE